MKDIRNITYYLNKNRETIAGDLRSAIKLFLTEAFQVLLKCELETHLGYNKNSLAEKETLNRRNGFTKKKIIGSFGELSIKVPRDRDSTFAPCIIKKRNKGIDTIAEKVLALFSIKIKEQDSITLLSDIYKDDFSKEKILMIQKSLDSFLKKHKLFIDVKEHYDYVFVDRLKINIPDTKNKDKSRSLFILTGVDKDNNVSILGIYIIKTTTNIRFYKMFKNIENRGIISIDTVILDNKSYIEEGLKEVYPDVKFIYT